MQWDREKIADIVKLCKHQAGRMAREHNSDLIGLKGVGLIEYLSKEFGQKEVANSDYCNLNDSQAGLPLDIACDSQFEGGGTELGNDDCFVDCIDWVALNDGSDSMSFSDAFMNSASREGCTSNSIRWRLPNTCR